MKHAQDKTFKCKIELDDVLFAIELIEFYQLNFKETTKLREIKAEPNLEDIVRLAKKNKAPQTAVMKITSYSKSHVSKSWNKVK